MKRFNATMMKILSNCVAGRYKNWGKCLFLLIHVYNVQVYRTKDLFLFGQTITLLHPTPTAIVLSIPPDVPKIDSSFAY